MSAPRRRRPEEFVSELDAFVSGWTSDEWRIAIGVLEGRLDRRLGQVAQRTEGRPADVLAGHRGRLRHLLGGVALCLQDLDRSRDRW